MLADDTVVLTASATTLVIEHSAVSDAQHTTR